MYIFILIDCDKLFSKELYYFALVVVKISAT